MQTVFSHSSPELWGGIECTVNRVGETYFSQLERNGHLEREGDIDRFAALGLKALRYPVIWELLAPRSIDNIEWGMLEGRLERMRALQIRPIAGLVHHGSGPRYAPLQSADFVTGLQTFARAVAEKFPWIEDYTPVNEPLTTARFCGLYGHWHPHGHDDATFLRLLLHECRATVEAMREVRKINPGARLVQTEDLGRVYATPGVAYQADFENERRWLSFDLLEGRVGRDHPLWSYLQWVGIEEAELMWFSQNPCPVDIVGINHYPTSDRFLDENWARYGEAMPPGNGRDIYADVEAVRVRDEPLGGFRERGREAWERYRRPVAFTEVHLGCTREEQLRWVDEAWRAALHLREEGADVCAVTLWSLLGAWNWNSLVTRDENHYEPGVFDTRSTAFSRSPRPTALAAWASEVSSGETASHPVLHQPGWWRRPTRLFAHCAEKASPRGDHCPLCDVVHEPSLSCALERKTSPRGEKGRDKAARPLLLVGATGTLGRAFARVCDERALPYYSVTRQDLDLSDAMSIEEVLGASQPWAVINAAGFVRVDDAERERDACFAVNTDAAIRLARACAAHGVAYACFSSDLVFDGRQSVPYRESDDVAPLGVYGQSKARMEAGVREAHPGALVARTSAFFGPWDEWNFVTLALRSLERGEPFGASEEIVSPTYVPELVHTTLDLLVDGERGVWHIANEGAVSWVEFGRRAARLYGFDENLIVPVTAHEPGRAPRPFYSALTSERGGLLSPLDEALIRYRNERSV